MLHDVRYALRSLQRAPGFAATAVLSLALGIGANTAIFSVVHHLLLDPLPYPGGERMVFLWRHNASMGGLVLPPTLAMVDAWRRVPALEAAEAHRARSRVMTGADAPEEVATLAVSPGIFELLDVQPRLGRTLVADDERAAAAPVALISERLWRDAFGSAPDVLGTPVVLDDVSHTIVGIMTPAFQFRESADDVWLPLKEATLKPATTVSTLGRLAPGVTVEDARAQLDAALAGVPDRSGWTAYIMTPNDRLGPAVRTSLLVLAGAVGFLLLIVCANVANLLLVRNAGREKEVAIRGALGAGRWRIARQFLAESLVLAAAGGGAGLLLALWLLDLVFSLRPEGLVAFHRVGINAPVLAFGVLVSLGTSLLFGLMPSLHAARLDLIESLKIGGRSGAVPRQWIRRGLTAAQVALALVLLIGAGLLARSYLQLQATDLGFDPGGVWSMRFELPASRYRESAVRADVVARMLDVLRANPAVERASLGPGLPPRSSIRIGRLQIDGRSLDPADTPTIFGGGSIDADYFRALRVPLKEGRFFHDSDRAGSPPVVIINESFARRFWPGESAIGRRIALSSGAPKWQTIVGVVGDVRAAGVASDVGRLQAYDALAQSPASYGTLVVRTATEGTDLAAALKAALWSVDPKLPAGEILTARQVAAMSYAKTRFNLVLLSAFAALGLTLAAVGVYGVVSFLTAQREHEIGVRIALGAARRDILALVLRQSLTMTALGLVAGVAGALAVSRLLEQLLYEIQPNDPGTFGAVLLFLVAVAFIATWLPARRAASIDPIIALKSE
jgi:putative ABC transport system permease protein